MKVAFKSLIKPSKEELMIQMKQFFIIYAEKLQKYIINYLAQLNIKCLIQFSRLCFALHYDFVAVFLIL